VPDFCSQEPKGFAVNVDAVVFVSNLRKTVTPAFSLSLVHLSEYQSTTLNLNVVCVKQLVHLKNMHFAASPVSHAGTVSAYSSSSSA